MKTFAFCFLLTLGCFFNSISAQSNSLITKLEKTLQIQIDSLGEEHLNIAMYCDSLGEMYLKVGKYPQADSLFTKALGIRVEKLEGKHPDIADSYHDLGNVNYYTGDYEEAISFYNKALNIWLEVLSEKHPHVAACYDNLGLVYNSIGDYGEAISFHHKALNIRLEVLDERHLHVAVSYNNLGIVYRVTGNYEKAINFQNKALDIALEVLGEKHTGVARCYNNLGNIYRNTGNYEKAINFHEKALNIWLEVLGEKHPYIGASYNNLGLNCQEIGDYEKAISFQDKALNIRIELLGKKHPDVATTYTNLGNIYSDIGEYEKAINFHNKALNIQLELLDERHSDVARSYHNLGIVNYYTRDYEKASNFCNKALDIWLEVLDQKHPFVAKSYYNLANTHEEIYNYNSADSLWNIVISQSIQQLKSTYLFLPNDQRVKYSNILTSTNINFYSFAAIHGTESTEQLATNLLLNTKSLALDYGISTNQLIQEINDTTLIAQHQQLNKFNKQLADAETLTIEEREKKGWDLAEIREEQEALAFQILQHPQLKSKLNTEIIEWQDVQNHLAPDEATIDFIEVYEKKDSLWAYYAVVIHKDFESPQFIRVIDEKTLTKLLQTDKDERPDYLHDRRSRKALYQALWQPLEPYLEGIKTVHISPSGILHRVPFESLQDTQNEYLATQYDFHYYSAIRDVLKDKPHKITYKDMILMGHILYDLDNKKEYEKDELIAWADTTRNIRGDIQPLKGTLEEVIKINKVGKKARLNTTVLTIDAPSEDTVQTFVGERAPSIMHFATHGVFLPLLDKHRDKSGLTDTRDRLRAADNPLQRSALMLYGANEIWTKGRRILGSGEDGILTALEVTALDLQKTDLVVLSACSTGLGNVHDTEGVFGLQRAFKLAGVNHVVASLWDVDDEATKDLMVRFYENLLVKKQDPATALRNAKNYFRDKGYEPVDWAGFILIE